MRRRQLLAAYTAATASYYYMPLFLVILLQEYLELAAAAIPRHLDVQGYYFTASTFRGGSEYLRYFIAVIFTFEDWDNAGSGSDK
jgi:hypothetical protein